MDPPRLVAVRVRGRCAIALQHAVHQRQSRYSRSSRARNRAAPLPLAPAWRLRLLPPRHLPARPSARDADRALALPDRPPHAQRAAGLARRVALRHPRQARGNRARRRARRLDRCRREHPAHRHPVARRPAPARRTDPRGTRGAARRTRARTRALGAVRTDAGRLRRRARHRAGRGHERRRLGARGAAQRRCGAPAPTARTARLRSVPGPCGTAPFGLPTRSEG